MTEGRQLQPPAVPAAAARFGERREGRGTWCLEIQGRRVELREGETTLGRSRGCGVVVKDPAVSRGHALLSLRGGRVTVQDLQSSNGTYLNGVRLLAETPMAEGDRLTVGETQAYLRLGRDERERPGPAASEGGLFCPACGVPVTKDAVRCPVCGRDLAGERLPHRSEAAAMGEVLPVGEVLGAASDAWDLTGPPGLSAAALGQAAEPSPSPPRLAAVPPLAHEEPTLQPAVPGPESEGRAAAGEAAEPRWEPAGFWVRAAACLLDLAAVALAAIVLSLPFLGPFTPRGSLLASVAALVLAPLVPLAGWCLWGATPGKYLLGLTVLGPDGRAGLSVGRALLRLLGYLLSALPLGAGFWIAAFSPERRALHDHLAGTRVVHAPR